MSHRTHPNWIVWWKEVTFLIQDVRLNWQQVVLYCLCYTNNRSVLLFLSSANWQTCSYYYQKIKCLKLCTTPKCFLQQSELSYSSAALPQVFSLSALSFANKIFDSKSDSRKTAICSRILQSILEFFIF